jgi:hypothetical protein
MNKLLLIACLAFATSLATAEEPSATPAGAGAENGFTGKVLETTNTAGYTYVLVDTGTQKHWAAANEFEVKTGDVVKVSPGVPMSNYHSKTLNRDFDMVYFTGSIKIAGGGASASVPVVPALPAGHPPLTGGSTPALPPGHPSITGQPAVAPNLDLTGIKRAKGGKTIEEIVAGKSKLAGKEVVVRGKVVKYNAQIMGKNWLHIQDGTGSADKKNNDLTVTTSTAAKVGDTVLVTGKLITDKDFGAGYKYSLIIEDAKVTAE